MGICLWDTYYDNMSEDFKRTHDNSFTAQLQCTLKNKNHFLESIGKKVKNYGIPKLEQMLNDGIISEYREIYNSVFRRFGCIDKTKS